MSDTQHAAMIGSAHFAEIARWFVSTRSKSGLVTSAHTSPASSSVAPMKPDVSLEYPYGAWRRGQHAHEQRESGARKGRTKSWFVRIAKEVTLKKGWRMEAWMGEARTRRQARRS